MASNGSAGERAESERGIDALAEMLAARGGNVMPGVSGAAASRDGAPATQPTSVSAHVDDVLAQLARSVNLARPESAATNGKSVAPTTPQFGRGPVVPSPTTGFGLAAQRAANAGRNLEAPAPVPEDGNLLMKAGQLADNMQGRLQELDRREQTLSEMMTALDQEQRRFRLNQQETRDETTGRESKLIEQENLLKQRLSQGQKLLDELQQREQEVEEARQQIDGDRLRLRADLQRELDVERASLKHERGLLETERKDLQARVEQVREEHETNLRQMRRDLEVERRRLRGQTAADVDAEREALKKEREEWLRTRSEQEGILLRQKEAHTAAMRRAEQVLADQQRKQLETFEQRRIELEKQFRESREKMDAERDAWNVKRTAEHEQLDRQRFLNVETLRKIEDEKLSREQQLATALQRAKDEHSQGLQAERNAFEQELQKRRNEFTQELEKLRSRFQDESARQRDQMASERQRFDESLQLDRDRFMTERTALLTQFEERSTEWTKRREIELSELARERQELERAAIEAEAELAERRRQLEDEARKAREDGLAELRNNWDIERQELRSKLASDIETERAQLAAEVKAFTDQQEREQSALKRAKESHEAALKQARTDIIAERQQANDEMRKERALHDAHFAAARGQLEAELKDRFEGTEQRIAQELDSLNQQKLAHQNIMAESSALLAAERRQLEESQAGLAAEHQQKLEALAERERRHQSDVHTHTVLSQQWQRRTGETAEAQRRRRSQLDRFRELLTERERSIAREEDVRERGKVEFESEKQRDRELVAEQHALLERQRQDLVLEKERQEQSLAMEYEKLKERTHRIEGLRKELEQTSLKNLEDRLAVEEALAELAPRIGETAAKQRVEEVRTVIAGRIHEMHNAARSSEADETARLVAFTQKQLEEEASRMKKDRESFVRRMAERERELQEQEAKLEERSSESHQREVKWRVVRDGWLKERVEAEQLIRGLLEELSVEG